MISMKRMVSLAVLAGMVSVMVVPAARGSEEKPNVLFISIDDLNDWVGCLGGHPQARTPNIDRLAEQGVLFTRNYCAAPMCNPSRTALFLGRRPDTTEVFGNQDEWQKICPQYTSIAGHFKNNGYYVAGCGKLFHQEKNTRPAEWDEYFGDFKQQIPKTKHRISRRPRNGIQGMPGFMDWGPLDTDDENMSDMQVAVWAESFLQRNHEQPFFLGAGIFLPHLPLYAPRKYFDMYPLEEVQMPAVKEDDLDDIPPRGQMLATRDKWSKAVRESGKARENVQAYLACLSFVDVCVGRILDALENSPYADNTIVILWSDHGMQKGEKGCFSKFTLWERATRCPLMIRLPDGVSGARCERTVNLIDLYPTLIELCDLLEVDGLDGQSLVPLLKDPSRAWNHPSVTIYHGDRTARSEQWRYILYADGEEELYDHKRDSNEWKNLAGNPELESIRKRLKASLEQQ